MRRVRAWAAGLMRAGTFRSCHYSVLCVGVGRLRIAGGQSSERLRNNNRGDNDGVDLSWRSSHIDRRHYFTGLKDAIRARR